MNILKGGGLEVNLASNAARQCMVYEAHYLKPFISIGVGGNAAGGSYVDVEDMTPCNPYCPGVTYTEHEIVAGLFKSRHIQTGAFCPSTGVSVEISVKKLPKA